MQEQNLAVNSLGPGLGMTEGTRLFNPGRANWDGWGDVETVAEPAIYLAGLDSSAYTGNVVHAPNFGKTRR